MLTEFLICIKTYSKWSTFVQLSSSSYTSQPSVWYTLQMLEIWSISKYMLGFFVWNRTLLYKYSLTVSVIILIDIDDHVLSGTKYTLRVYTNNNQKQLTINEVIWHPLRWNKKIEYLNAEWFSIINQYACILHILQVVIFNITTYD